MKTAFRYTLAVLLAFTLGVDVVPQPPNSAEIPLRSSHALGLMLVEARVNGKPAVLILDTGSNVTIVSSKLVDVATPSLKDGVRFKKGSGYAGYGIFAKASLAIGPVVWWDHRILATDTDEISKSLGERVDGLLGLDFLSEFEIVTVDLKQHKLLLKHSMNERPSEHTGDAGITPEYHRPTGFGPISSPRHVPHCIQRNI